MEFVGFMNSAQVYCLQKNGSTIAAKKKKKKLRKCTILISTIQTSTKLYGHV